MPRTEHGVRAPSMAQGLRNMIRYLLQCVSVALVALIVEVAVRAVAAAPRSIGDNHYYYDDGYYYIVPRFEGR